MEHTTLEPVELSTAPVITIMMYMTQVVILFFGLLCRSDVAVGIASVSGVITISFTLYKWRNEYLNQKKIKPKKKHGHS